MHSKHAPFFSSLTLALSSICTASAHIDVGRRDSNPLNINLDPAPSPEEGPPFSANALRDPAFLPAQIGGIVGAYALSLIFVALTLISLTKRRREQLNAGNDEAEFEECQLRTEAHLASAVELKENITIPNFSYPSPQKAEFGVIEPHEQTENSIYPSPTSSVCGPGVNPFVDQNVVAADKAMAQDQLEQMYRHVMEHEEAKERGVVTESVAQVSPTSPNKKGRAKPASLNLSDDGRPQSRTSSLLSSLRSKKNKPKGVNISSPMMTPQSATFPRLPDPHANEPQTPRYYAPPPPLPAPREQVPRVPVSPGIARTSSYSAVPDQSPESVLSIDERIAVQMDQLGMRHSNQSNPEPVTQSYHEPDPQSAVSAHSQTPLIGLPSSPKSKTSFSTLHSLPSLPSSPKPGASFPRTNAPSAVRTGGALPLRAYEPSLSSPTSVSHSTKQTVFERKGPLSPMSARTPGTAMPYSPYQPFTPCVPVTPSLVTKEERKRMRKMVPKTPTLEMVKSSEEIW